MIAKKLTADTQQALYSCKDIADNELHIAASFGLNSYQLMERAANALWQFLQTYWPQNTSLLIVTGKGNNGGDGYVLARLARNYSVAVHSVCDPKLLAGDAQRAYQDYLQSGGKVNTTTPNWNDYDVIVDGLLGTGITGPVRDEYIPYIAAINRADAKVLSIDLPSGLNGDTGQALGEVVLAHATVTFVGIKKGLVTGRAKAYTGALYFDDLGLGKGLSSQLKSPFRLNAKADFSALTSRDVCGHKGRNGCVLVVSGAPAYPGAAMLSSFAALRSGAGLVALCCHPSCRAMIAPALPEIVYVDLITSTDEQNLGTSINRAKSDVVLLGPGLGRSQWSEKAFEQAIALNKTMVIDADGLYYLSKTQLYRNNWVLTPHPGEAAYLLKCSIEDIEADRYQAIANIVQKYGGVCVLKGAGTLISNGQHVRANISGNPGMAVAGMGDVLSGILASISLQSTSLYDAACLAVNLHGQAADRAVKQGEKGLLASDIMPYIRTLVNQF
ncbi:NAD(P)H-hydrate dehydratase [Thalassotalea aquiviva]|uniref:NAD(P)H-hydrate dehydratase n=1 Tax=Thalassotalea aquiviva TaxID=3242415 RepID=UPI00352A32F0